MNYYLLEPDKKAQETPKVVNWYQKIDTTCMTPELYHKLPEVTVLYADFAPNTQFKEVVIAPFFLLPKEAGKLLKAFEPWMEFKDVVLLDTKTRQNHKFVFPLLKKYNCLSKKSVLNKDKTVLEKVVLIKDKIPDAVLFSMEGVNSRQVIAREDFIEVLLQDNYFGYRLKQVEITERD